MTTTTTATVPPPGPGLVPARGARRRSPRRARRWLKRGALVLVAAGAVTGGVYAWLPKPVPVDAAVVHRAPLVVTVDEDGRTRMRARFVVSAPVGGNLERIADEAGAAVTRGAVLARIQPLDPALLDRRTLSEARARLSAALAHQRQAKTAVTRARASAAAADRELERARGLLARGAITAAERERAELASELAGGDRAAAELAVEAAAAEVTGARAVLAGGTRDGAPVEVLAPSAGKILRVVRDDAGPIAAGTPLLEIGDPESLEVVVDVLSSDAARIAVGAPVVIDGWGGAPFAGTVRLVEPAAVTRISALGIEEQRVDVIVALDAAPPALGDGFRVEARIEIWRSDDTVVVPAGALFRDKGRWAVYAIAGDTVTLQPVELGQRNQLEAEVKGIAVGTRVVVHPSDRVADGVAVQVR
jgi:HlyD family secretion protein